MSHIFFRNVHVMKNLEKLQGLPYCSCTEFPFENGHVLATMHSMDTAMLKPSEQALQLRHLLPNA